MLRREPFPGTREARLHLIGDKHDPMLTANLLHDFEVSHRRDDEASFTEHRLCNYCGDRFRSDAALESVLQVVRKRFRGSSAFAAIRVGERNAIDVAGKRFEPCLVGMRLAGQRHRQQGAAVKRVFEANH